MVQRLLGDIAVGIEKRNTHVSEEDVLLSLSHMTHETDIISMFMTAGVRLAPGCRWAMDQITQSQYRRLGS